MQRIPDDSSIIESYETDRFNIQLLEKCQISVGFLVISTSQEMVDQQVITSLSLEPTSLKIRFSNFKPSINKYIG